MKFSKLKNTKNLTNSEKEVLEFLLNNNNEVLNLGVRGVAKANFTSTSTVMRLAQKLGYSGFIEMHYKIAEYLIKNDNSDEIISDIGDKIIDTPHELLEEFAQMIHSQEKNFIYIYATGFSTIVAEYIYKKLLILGKKCLISSGADSIGVFENNLNNIDFLVVISKSGETQQVIDKIKMANDEGIKVVSFTGNNDNTINYLSSLPIICKDNFPADDYNQFSNAFFPNVLYVFEKVIGLSEKF
ncbi:MurR/RpiR family transcriptional regulator [Companilactobacillus sp. FL22-1]|uniref:MurR/RpiR family transcriptional regulator n=1 Tax=Companilactobacillus sp. FL22-1 TaxID=3373892 RepID=UPI003754FC11